MAHIAQADDGITNPLDRQVVQLFDSRGTGIEQNGIFIRADFLGTCWQDQTLGTNRRIDFLRPQAIGPKAAGSRSTSNLALPPAKGIRMDAPGLWPIGCE